MRERVYEVSQVRACKRTLHRRRSHLLLLLHLLFLVACSDLTRRDLDVDRVRFISPPHAKACKLARERARLTGDRYLGSVIARGSLPRRFRICGASSHARVDRAIAYRLWKTQCVRYFEPRWCRYDFADYNTGQLPIRVRLEEKMTRTASTWEWVTFNHLVYNIYA